MKKERINTLLVYLCYTLGFVVLTAIISSILYFNKKSLVYMGDALLQQYPTQFYLMKTFGNILEGIKKFNFNIGLGQDILTTYHYYGLTDPINILLGLFSYLDPNLLYYCSFGIRIYLAGIAFLAMCIHFSKRKDAMVIGALIYVFSNFSLSAAVMYPYFINTMIYMPLMIIGVDKIIKDNKILFFILVSILTIFVNIYLAYMLAVLVFVYALVSIIFDFRKNRFINTCKIFGRGILSYIIALLISAVIVVPIAYSFLTGISASGISYNLPVITGEHDLLKYFTEIFQTPNVEKFSLVGISIVTLFAVISLFINKGKAKLKVLFLLILLIIIVPDIQSTVAITHYGNYRWYFAEILLLAYIFVDQYDELLNLASSKKVFVYLLLIFYTGFITYINVEASLAKKLTYRDIEFFKPLLVTVIAFFMMLILNLKKKKLKKGLFLAFTFLALAMNMGVYAYDSGNSDMLADFSYLDRLVNDRTLKLLTNSSRDTFERIDNSGENSFNLSDIYDYPSTSIYYGLENKNLAKFNFIYRNAAASPINKMHNFDQRAILDDIMSVKYYIPSNNKKVPYGFKRLGNEKIYINSNYIPFGFTYDKYIMPYEVASMGVLDMQETLLKACLVDEKPSEVKHLESSVISEMKLRKSNITYTSNYSGKVSGDKGIDIDLECQLPYSGELYLKLADVDEILGVEKINIKTGKSEFSVELTKPSSEWYVGEKDLVINLGYFEKGKRKILIHVDNKYDFNMQDLKLECRELGNLKTECEKLAREHLKDIKIQNDGFSASIVNKGYKLLFISIPYDQAWTAEIDGVERKIYKANEAFMAVKLEPGDHTINFKYKRPFKTVSFVISALGLIVLVLYLKKRKNKRLEELDDLEHFYEEDEFEEDYYEEEELDNFLDKNKPEDEELDNLLDKNK